MIKIYEQEYLSDDWFGQEVSEDDRTGQLAGDCNNRKRSDCGGLISSL